MKEYTVEEKSTPVELWYIDLMDHSVSLLKAFPRMGDTYWVPNKGTSARLGHTLFEDRANAIAEAKKIISNEMHALEAELRALEQLEKL